MSRFITAAQYKKLTQIPRGRLSVRTQIYCGTIVKENGKILLVKSFDDKFGGWDFPGGKLLWSEDVFSCAKREMLEEGRYKVKLKRILGIYQRKTSPDEEDYFRFIFIGELLNKRQRKIGDPNISDTKWFYTKDLIKNKLQVRSPEVIREVGDYVNGKSFPLDVVELYVW